jgi:hypothetical protein
MSGAGEPAFGRAFLNRVWKFDVEIDDVYAPGKLQVTIGNVLQLPKGMKAQGDALANQAAIVVLSGPSASTRTASPPAFSISSAKQSSRQAARARNRPHRRQCLKAR